MLIVEIKYVTFHEYIFFFVFLYHMFLFFFNFIIHVLISLAYIFYSNK